MPGGSCLSAAVIADWTSSAAASIERLSTKETLMLVTPWPLVEVIESMPAMVENCFSSGVATAAAMVSGLAPGKLAVTEMFG